MKYIFIILLIFSLLSLNCGEQVSQYEQETLQLDSINYNLELSIDDIKKKRKNLDGVLDKIINDLSTEKDTFGLK